MAEVLSQHRDQHDMRIVGFYRTYTGGAGGPSAADLELFRLYFPDEHFAFLLLRPNSPDQCEATFLFRKDGILPSKPAYPWLDFTAEGMNCNPDPVAVAEHVEKSAGLVQPEPADGGTMRRLRLPLAALALAGVAAAGVYQWSKRSVEPPPVDLKLDARRLGGILELRWERASPAVTRATHGVLNVSEGESTKNVAMTQEQLRAGTALYPTPHSDVLFRLQLYGTNIRPTGDSIRIVTLAPPAAPPPVAMSPEPVAVHKVQPEISDRIRSRLASPVVIAVDVRISPAGKVTQVSVQGKKKGVQKYLANSATKAARNWRFTPARSTDGTPVASKKTLQFEFQPSGS